MIPYTAGQRTRGSWLKAHDAAWAGQFVRQTASATVLLLCLAAVTVVYWDHYPRELSIQTADRLVKGHPCRSGDSDSQMLGPTSSAWKIAAATNLSDFRASLAARMRPLNRDTSYWPHFPPVIWCPPDRPLTRYGGSGDGSKLLCRLPTSLRDGTPCVIYSLGSNGNYHFEQAMLEASQCEVHTFDCTYKGASQHQGRHFYHMWCVGDPQQGPEFRTFAQLMRDLNHTSVDLLKMDIEGHEYPVMEAFRASKALPPDLSVELHVNDTEIPTFRSTVELGLQFFHLAELGYAAYSREPNPLCPHCCEFSFLRVQ